MRPHVEEVLLGQGSIHSYFFDRNHMLMLAKTEPLEVAVPSREKVGVEKKKVVKVAGGGGLIYCRPGGRRLWITGTRTVQGALGGATRYRIRLRKARCVIWCLPRQTIDLSFTSVCDPR